ncbi:hypothetical protein QZH41_009328 [Actinostola sp. cb2023]|nr:hypothetical protein QZH41_009328 [Actinostola sp. cb2023]
MPSNVIALCLSVLQLFFFVQAKEFPAKLRIKDNFELPTNNKHTFDVTHRLLHRQRRESQSENPFNKPRSRRDAACVNPTNAKNIVKDQWKFPDDDKHVSFSMTWVGKNYQTILLLATTEFFIFSIQRSALYRSTDYGTSFKKINTDIYGGNIRKDFGIQRSPVDPNRVILVSFSLPILGRPSTLYISKDGAMKWKKVDLSFRVSNGIEFHPRNKDWLIAKGSTLQQGAYLSTDFGFTWKKLRPYVISVKWGARQDKKVEKEEKTIFLTMAPIANNFINIYDLQLWRSRDLGKNFKLISKHVYSFGVQGPFLFFTVDFNKNNRTRIMHVSKDGGDTNDVAGVPSILPMQFYSILDMSEGMVFLHVDNEKDTGKGVLYTSDADGIVFDKSLENHMYTNFDGITDFYKVESMNGTYITSRMNDDKSLTTVITFDRGGEWNPINLDQSHCAGQQSRKAASVCSLQIHNKFSKSRHISGVAMGPISEATAVGVIVAHANPGYALLSKNIGIWISRDGGYTWKTQTSLSGAHHYAIADHGNLLLAIPASGQDVKSLLILYVNPSGCFPATFHYLFRL